MSAFSSVNVKVFYFHLLNISVCKRLLIPHSFQGQITDTFNYTAFFLTLVKIQVIGKIQTVFAHVNVLTADILC